MPFDMSPLDAVALAWFLALWAGYNLTQDYFGPIGINRHMRAQREAWMRRMLARDNRMMDASLIGHLIQSVSFFASGTLLVLAGIVGMLGAVDQVHRLIGELSFTARTTRELFELKLMLLLVIFIYAFFKFTWALRQFNYSVALIGAAPLPPVPAAQGAEVARCTSAVLSLAVAAFNGGLRAYYFALAVLSWFVQPWLFMLVTAGMLGVLLMRQTWSRAHDAIGRHTATLEAGEDERR